MTGIAPAGYISVVTATPRAGRWLALLRRLVRWRPATHVQVWSWTTGTALIIIGVLYLAAGGWELPGMLIGGLWAAFTGAAESYRLSKRRHASVVADWVATRRPSRLPGG